MTTHLLINLPKLHARQSEILADETRYRVLCCGRRWGKTRLAAVAAASAALRGGRVWWLAPTYQTSLIGFRLVKGMVSAIPGVECRDGDRSIRLLGGSIWFKSADSGDGGLRGEGLDLVIFDEAAFCPREAWEQQIRPALADRKGRAIFISTPNREGDWFHEAFMRGQLDGSGWRSWHLPSWSNPYLDADEIDEARQGLPSIVFRREFGAEFVSAAGARLRREWLRTSKPSDDELRKSRISMGVDLAISTKDGADYTACVVLAKHEDGRLWILDAARDRLPFDRVLAFVRQMADKWKPAAIAIEQVQYQAAVVQELLRTTNLPVRGVRPDKDKVTRFQPVEARIEQGLVQIAPDLPPWFTAELLAFPLGEHDDACDALAYAYAAGGRSLEWS
jgi:predicted phage terminase large subunit-like protein